MNKRVLSLTLVFTMVLSLFGGIIIYQAEGAEMYYINDDFESDTPGQLPEGWIIKYNGDGDDKQIVVNNVSKSGSNSFKIDGRSGWSATIYKNLPNDLSDNLVVEAYVMPAATGESGSISLLKTPAFLARVVFKGEQISYSTTGHDDNNLVNLQPYTVGTWYHVKIVHDMVSRTYDIYIDGINMASDIPMYSEYSPVSLVLTSGNGSGDNIIYFDDVMVYGEPSIVEISGEITEATNWTSDNIYHITGKTNIRAPLTIESGTIVKFASEGYIFVRESLGSLIAKGTAENPVFFTSIKDDIIGGDTNNDGDTTSPSSGDWPGIRNTFGYSIDLEHTEIRYAGKTISNMGMYSSVNNYGNLNLSNVSIYNSSQNGIYINDYQSKEAPSTINACSIYDNALDGIRINAVGSSQSIKNSNIYNNGGCGITIDNSQGQVSIENNNIKENNLNPLCISNSPNISLINNSVEELEATASPGSTEGSTKIQVSALNNNHIGIRVSQSAIVEPYLFDEAPTGQGIINPYTSGDDILDVNFGVNNHISVYELNNENLIVKYKQIILADKLKGYASWNNSTNNSGIIVTAKQGENTINSTETNTDGLFELYLENGTYDVVLSKPGYLQRTILNVIISNGISANLGSIDNPITLLAGDVNADTKVNAQDLSLLLAAFNKTSSDPGYILAADFNGDYSINATDLSSLLANFNKTISDYPIWVQTFAGGDGSEGNPYQVSNSEQLNSVRNYLDKYFIQIADIDLSGYVSDGGWEPIGEISNPFIGGYDGDGYSITNLFINKPNISYVGLFGSNQGTLISIGIKNVDVTGDEYVGGLCGMNSSDASRYYGSIVKSFTTGEVKGNKYVGGLAGGTPSNYLQVNKSFSTASVVGNSSIGGLVGMMYGEITDCYSTGDVTGTTGSSRIGGLIGEPYGNIKNCYSTGAVVGSSQVGGLLGSKQYDPVSSYYNTETSGQTDTGNGVALTRAEMVDKVNYSNWDFEDIWDIGSDPYTYPYFKWQTDLYPEAGLSSPEIIGHWAFDEGQGDIAGDSSGNHNDGTIKGALWTTDKSDLDVKALEFAQNKWVDIPDTLKAETITLSAWIFITGRDTSAAPIFSAETGQGATNFSYRLQITPDYKLRMEAIAPYTTSGARVSTSDSPLDTNRWYHVAGTYDGITTKLYIDGQLVESDSHSNYAALNINSTIPVGLGHLDKWSVQWFRGKIDDARIYKGTLTSTEIEEISGNNN